MSAVPRRPRPPARPRAERPASAAPEPDLAFRRADGNPRLAQRTVTPPAHSRPRFFQPQGCADIAGKVLRLLHPQPKVGVAGLPAAEGSDVDAYGIRALVDCEAVTAHSDYTVKNFRRRHGHYSRRLPTAYVQGQTFTQPVALF